MISTNMFYGKRKAVVIVPANPAISDDEEDEEDDVEVDPDYIPVSHNLDTPTTSEMSPPAKRRHVQPAVEVILVLRWKDNKVVTLLSTDMGVEPLSSVYRFSSESKKKEPVSCPAVIKSYNSNMGGIDKSDMLVHLYRTPMKSKRWYMRLFAYTIDLAISNAWLMYRRDCKELKLDSQSLKSFRIEVFKHASNQRLSVVRLGRSSDSLRAAFDVPKPVRGHRCSNPTEAVRFDHSVFHVPVYTHRQTCKYCSRKDNIARSNVFCGVCKVHLCLNATRNCFAEYHNPK
ncbi:piggyBac transposable element-derived protein 2-like [Cyprinodon tularosa]|uniref:piggyBac transposable element-derived protein 2-like n=1 Tax=Cyprinodon tularosa TaxID=77115 RepID=UPI0018E1F8A9|nr:piggyBac transposable element-derived protein 2-like [Cyprinodon tularosa]XP_038135823.1 piggyBac transposable element-derived protein 2-like [Cyprinodon tularosa]XP_038145157.1 piggyBac transposable element-derived protein 2-like [Cyprinodon tularosa]